MMRIMRKFIAVGVLVCLSHASFANSVDWFNEQSALYTAHKQFLEGDAKKGLITSIEVLQSSTNENIANNIDKLLSSAISINCGRDLSNKKIPSWLNTVIVERVIVQSPGRLHHRLIVKFDSKKEIANLSFIKWPQEEQLTNPSIKRIPTQDERVTQYIYASESLNNRIQNGLYKLIITADDEEKTSWESWIVLTTPKTEMQVTWSGKDKWKTTQTGLIKSNCPLPEMAIAIYDHQDNEYIKLWEQTYEEKFPTSLPPTNVLPGSYILSVSFNHKRFQGPISIQEIQAITKVINFSSDEK